ncbi:hypothetical protein Pelo_16167 [Pelomyxa schiedti]|nr:hypothetical protein Pelo_16167 [Pelomyxa schiedti]
MGIEWSGTSWMYPWWSPNQSSQAQGNIQHTETTATTIHIIDHMDPEASDDGRSDDAMEFRKQLIKQLYSKILWDKDPLFHFFYEPFLIVRVTTKEALEGVRSHLDSNNINFLEYSYPFTDFKKPGITVCDERNSPLVAERSDIFMPLLHAHSVAALSLSDEEHSLVTSVGGIFSEVGSEISYTTAPEILRARTAKV